MFKCAIRDAHIAEEKKSGTIFKRHCDRYSKEKYPRMLAAVVDSWAT
jgi:hypothetical protein